MDSINTNRRIIQTLDSADQGTTKQLIMRVYYISSIPRDYPFNLTITPNTSPYFTSSLPIQHVNCGYNITINIPSAIDDEGEPFAFALDRIPSSASSFSHSENPSHTAVTISSISCSLAGIHTYRWKVYEDSTNKEMKNYLDVQLQVNYLPKFNYTFPDITYRIYINETDFSSPSF